MKLGVTGTRDGFSDEQRKFILTWITGHKYDPAYMITEFHYGDCVGVDEQMLWVLLFGGSWEQGKPWLHVYPAKVSEKWKAKTYPLLIESGYPQITVYEPLPPLVRNGHIAERCDFLLAFPGSGGGTWDCVRKAQAFGREGLIVARDGVVTPL